jgi:hypothetical protein
MGPPAATVPDGTGWGAGEAAAAAGGRRAAPTRQPRRAPVRPPAPLRRGRLAAPRRTRGCGRPSPAAQTRLDPAHHTASLKCAQSRCWSGVRVEVHFLPPGTPPRRPPGRCRAGAGHAAPPGTAGPVLCAQRGQVLTLLGRRRRGLGGLLSRPARGRGRWVCGAARTRAGTPRGAAVSGRDEGPPARGGKRGGRAAPRKGPRSGRCRGGDGGLGSPRARCATQPYSRGRRHPAGASMAAPRAVRRARAALRGTRAAAPHAPTASRRACVRLCRPPAAGPTAPPAQ